jgi:hypothetical protein
MVAVPFWTRAVNQQSTVWGLPAVLLDAASHCRFPLRVIHLYNLLRRQRQVTPAKRQVTVISARH